MSITHDRMVKNGYTISGSRYQCRNGHHFTDTFNNIKHREYRCFIGRSQYSSICPTCKDKSRLDGIVAELADIGYELKTALDNGFSPRKSIIEVMCRNGHVLFRKLENIREYPGCEKCRLSANGWFEVTKSLGIPVIEKTAINKAKLLLKHGLVEKTISQISIDYMRNPYELFGYSRGELVEEHTRPDRSKYFATCSQGHQFTTSTRFLLEGHGCRLCSLSQLNDPEKIIGGWIEDMGIPIARRDSSIIGEELDIYVPSRNVAIEYCGIRWHSIENARKGRNPEKNELKFKYKHQKKMLKCLEKNVHLITVFESDWIHAKEYVKDRILDAITNVIPNDNDLRYRKLLSTDKYSEPKPLYFDRSYRQLDDDEFAKYTVYDCGHLLE